MKQGGVQVKKQGGKGSNKGASKSNSPCRRYGSVTFPLFAHAFCLLQY
jgi:hypothetical protein